MLVKYSREKYGLQIHRFLYDWVLSWADTPLGGWALFVLALIESVFFPIPPDPLLIALVLSLKKKALRYALITSIASTLGGFIGYYIGYELWYSGEHYSAIANFFFTYVPGASVDNFLIVKKLYNEYSFWVVFTAGFTPIPYKVITISAGITKIDLAIFAIASITSRSLRFFLVSGLIWKYGAPIKDFIEKRFNLVSIAFVVLLLGGFVVIKYIL
ncbi:MAG: YqaA family protein [Spirochaetota bacterium]|nr:YqaA family protein [Spirochaetota bacterium]